MEKKRGKGRFEYIIHSGIDQLLANEDVTLAEVLRSEDLIQEVNGFNETLYDYLMQPEIAKAIFK